MEGDCRSFLGGGKGGCPQDWESMLPSGIANQCCVFSGDLSSSQTLYSVFFAYGKWKFLAWVISSLFGSRKCKWKWDWLSLQDTKLLSRSTGNQRNKFQSCLDYFGYVNQKVTTLLCALERYTQGVTVIPQRRFLSFILSRYLKVLTLETCDQKSKGPYSSGISM